MYPYYWSKTAHTLLYRGVVPVWCCEMVRVWYSAVVRY